MAQRCEEEIPDRLARHPLAVEVPIGEQRVVRIPDQKRKVKQPEHEQERENMHRRRAPAALSKQPDDEHEDGECRSPLRGGAETEKRARELPPSPQGEQQADRKKRGREE